MIGVYIAAPWIHRTQAQDAARKCMVIADLCVTSRWIFSHEDSQDADNLTKQAWQDSVDVRLAQYVIVLNSALSEGKATELGMALMLGKQVIIVGKPEDRSRNIFYYLPNIRYVTTLEEAIAQCL